jgi:nucleoside-diphosphate-sugar epimerase
MRLFVIIAITGGTGFIGRRLIARHVALGDEVRYLTRKTEQSIVGAEAIIGDLAVVASLHPLVQDADVLYHCAAELHNAYKMYATNVQGTENLLTAVDSNSEFRQLRWVQLSSTGVYGSKPAHDVHEDTPLNPNNAYEISKAKADTLVYQSMLEQKLQGVILRPSNVYGVDMPNQSLFQLINMIKRGLFFFIGDKAAVVNYIHVDNVINALLLCGTATLPSNARSYIVSDSCLLTEFVAVIASELQVPCPTKRLPEALLRFAAQLGQLLPRFPLTPSRVDALTYHHCYKTNRIESELGYQHTISIQQGISELARHAG